MKIEFSEDERDVLTEMFNLLKKEIKLYRYVLVDKLGKDKVRHGTDRLKKRGFITKEEKGIFKIEKSMIPHLIKRLDETKNLNGEKRNKHKKQYPIWNWFKKNFPTAIIVTFIVISVGLLTFSIGTAPIGCEMVGRAERAGSITIDKVYIKSPYAGCYSIPIEDVKYHNETLYEDKECMIPYEEKNYF